MKTLLDFPPGASLRISGYAAVLPADLRAHLSAWGLFPGTRVTLLGHRPVIRLAVEHAELALEREVAGAVLAELADSAAAAAPVNGKDSAPSTPVAPDAAGTPQPRHLA